MYLNCSLASGGRVAAGLDIFNRGQSAASEQQTITVISRSVLTVSLLPGLPALVCTGKPGNKANSLCIVQLLHCMHFLNHPYLMRKKYTDIHLHGIAILPNVPIHVLCAIPHTESTDCDIICVRYPAMATQCNHDQ